LYAIELLERVKHIFGIDGLIFVLSIDKKQLSESIKSQYGNIDTNSYLKRFIDLEFNLTNNGVYKFCKHLFYSVYKLDKLLLSKDIRREYGDYNEFEMLKFLAKSMDLSLREIEQAFIQINIIFKTINPRIFEMHFRVIVFFVILKLKDLELYVDLIYARKSAEEVLITIFKKIVKNELYKHEYNEMKRVIKAIVLSTSKTDDEMNLIIQKQKDKLNGFAGDEYQDHFMMISILENIGKSYGLNKAIDTVIKKIDFIDKFNLNGIE